MSHTTTGIVVNGELHLSEPLALPDQTPVSVIIQRLPAEKVEAIAAWQRTLERLKLHPIHGGGKRYTRDELHERR
jgi:hypothetical protein